MAAEKSTETRPRSVDEAREILSRAFNVPPERLAEHFGMSEAAFAIAVTIAQSQSLVMGEPFLYEWAKIVALTTDARPAHGKTGDLSELVQEHIGVQPQGQPSTTGAATVPETDDHMALAREVSGLDAKVNILLGLGSTLLVGVIAGAIALWQAMGGVETRLARELGEVETRITQQIGDVRSEVGEIRGRLSVAQPSPPPR